MVVNVNEQTPFPTLLCRRPKLRSLLLLKIKAWPSQPGVNWYLKKKQKQKIKKEQEHEPEKEQKKGPEQKHKKADNQNQKQDQKQEKEILK